MKHQPKEITSKSNERFREWKELSTRKGRARQGRFLVEGFRSLSAALDAGREPETVIIRNDVLETPRFREMLSAERFGAARVFALPPNLFNALSTRETPQGVAAVFSIPAPADAAGRRWRWVSLLAENIQDPRNVGLLIRTADAAGCDALFLTRGSADPFHPEAAAASMGSLFHLRIHTDVSAADVIAAARRADAVVAGASGRAGANAAAWARAARPPILLLLGNEGAGLSEQLAGAADVTVGLPMYGGAESLNVAVAAGIICWLLRADAPPNNS